MTTLTEHEEYCRDNPHDRTAMLALIDRHAEVLDVSMKVARGACRAMRRKWRRERELVEAAKLLATDSAMRRDIYARVTASTDLPLDDSVDAYLVDGEGPPRFHLWHTAVSPNAPVRYAVTLYAHWVLTQRDQLQAAFIASVKRKGGKYCTRRK